MSDAFCEAGDAAPMGVFGSTRILQGHSHVQPNTDLKHGLLSAQLHSTVGKPDTRHIGEFKLCNHGPHKFHMGTMTKDAGSDVSLGLNPSFPTY